MPIRLRDRVKQNTVSVGTGTVTLSTSFASFKDFSDVLSDGDTTYYAIENTTDFEVGEGTYSGNTLSRDQVFSSSNGDSLVSLVGVSTVFITYPASKSVHLNGSGNVTGIECIDFKLGATPDYSEGRVFYDNVNHALAVYNDEADITLQVGQEEYLRVRNNSGSTILNGQAVRMVGSQGTNPIVELAIATDFNSSNVVGLATHDIENNSFGYVTTFGLVNDVDTSDFLEGSELYLSPLVSGGLTGVAPSSPFYQSPIGVCVRSHPSVGTVLVQPRATKLGGFDVKNLGDIQNSGIPFISDISESSGAILATNTGFYYSVSTDTLHVPSLVTNEITSTGENLILQRNGADAIAIGGSFVQFYDEIRPASNNLYSNGTSALRWSDVYSVDGNFSGELTADIIKSSSTAFTDPPQIRFIGSRGYFYAKDLDWAFRYDHTDVDFLSNILPLNDNDIVCGQDGNRWSSIASVDGDFNGLLNASGISVDVGGSFNMYSLGADGDADTESLSIDYDSPDSRWLISADDPTGTGLPRQLWFDASQLRMYESNTLLWIGESNQLRMYGDIVPSSDGLKNLGISSRKFLGVNAINGDFSGTLTTDFMQSNSGSFNGSVAMAGDLILTGLQYSDPANSGQIWQSGQFLRVSHG